LFEQAGQKMCKKLVSLHQQEMRVLCKHLLLLQE
jgi:hypothetical protein